MTPERLFHLMPVADAEAFLAGDADWAPTSLASEGFVHLSFAGQVPGTLDVHYANADEMMLLEVCPERTGADLRLEVSRAGAKFPHLYRPLARADVLRTWRLEHTPSGWTTPALQ